MSPKLLNILLVLIPAILYYGVFDPLYTGKPGLIWTPESSISALQSTNVQYTNTINLVSKVEKDIKKVNEEYQAIKADATTTHKVMKMLPDSIDPIVLRSEVISIADNKGVSIIDVGIKEDAKNVPQGLGAYLVTFSVKGRYPVLKNLLQEYEKNLRFYTVETIDIQRQEAKGLTDKELLDFDKESLSAKLVYKVYYLK